jgi:hypothetical protein
MDAPHSLLPENRSAVVQQSQLLYNANPTSNREKRKHFGDKTNEVPKSQSGGMADALDSKSSTRKGVWVQVPPLVLMTDLHVRRMVRVFLR